MHGRIINYDIILQHKSVAKKQNKTKKPKNKNKQTNGSLEIKFKISSKEIHYRPCCPLKE